MSSQKPSYWLMKTEPTTYSFDQLLKDRQTQWNGVRNFQARNHLRQIQPGDWVLIYHSGDDKAVMGVAQVTREAYPDLDPKKPGDWVQVDLKAHLQLKKPVKLSQIKATEKLKDLPLIRHTRLSVMPISALHFETLLKLGETPATEVRL